MLTPFFVRDGGLLKKIHPDQVTFLEAAKNYTNFYRVGASPLELRVSIETALKMMPRDLFVRTHRSYAVSLYYIDEISKDDVVVEGRTSIPIGRQYYRSFINRLTIFTVKRKKPLRKS